MALLAAAWAGLAAALPAAAQEAAVLEDPRLDADSTLFLHEWPALDALVHRLERLRPALEQPDPAALAEAAAEVRARADSLAADTLPTLLTPRGQELRGRTLALLDALRLAEELAGPALATAAPAGAVAIGEGWRGGFPVTIGPSGEAPGDSAASAGEPYDPAGWPEAADEALEEAGQTGGPAGMTGDSAAASDPVGAFLAAWRDVYAHAEALVHRVRDPDGGAV